MKKKTEEKRLETRVIDKDEDISQPQLEDYVDKANEEIERKAYS